MIKQKDNFGHCVYLKFNIEHTIIPNYRTTWIKNIYTRNGTYENYKEYYLKNVSILLLFINY